MATPLEDRLREQLQSTTTQLREAQGRLGALETAKTAAEQERDALKAKSAGASPTASRELSAAKSQNSALRSQLDAGKTELAAANARVAELTATLAASRTELGQARLGAEAANATAATNASAIKACYDANVRLVATGRELVALHSKRYGNGTFPPLQLLRTKIENEAQAMGDRVNSDAIVVNPASEPPK
ncbi:MAG: hypothetical protein ACOYLS_10705 [Polymorphobacter sp.]